MGLAYYTIADRKFYDTMDFCPVNAGDYLTFVENSIDARWTLVRKGIWINCMPVGAELPLQGWKIHLSSTPDDSRALLETAVRHLVALGVPFKFLLDRRTLRLTNSKSWNRGGSGKFMTVYPRDEEQFRLLLASLHELTKNFRGPYILSDRRYEDSKVVYYRYGGFRANSRLEADGTATPLLTGPAGETAADVRGAYFSVPPWVESALPPEKVIPAGAGLDGGRYAVRRAVHFSNTGGIYVAFDSVLGREVILKEARAHVHSVSDGLDAAAMLRREFAMLKTLADARIAPEPHALFQEWDHLFVAEQYLEGYVTLRRHAARDSVLFDVRPTPASVQTFLSRYLTIFRNLAAVLDALHAKGVVFGDLSANNIMVHPETLDVKLIDLESACAGDGDDHSGQYTPGYADAAQMAGSRPSFATDYYAFGSVMLFQLTHVNDLLELRPEARREFLREVSRDFGFPSELAAVIENLLDADPRARERPSVHLARVPADRIGDIWFASADPRAELPRAALERLIRESSRFVRSNADYHRSDRLFPADPAVFQTNPLSAAFGAVGVISALAKAGDGPEPAMLAWIGQRTITAGEYAPGLYAGLAGVAWGLLELGRTSEAEAALEESIGHPLLADSCGLYHGLAGWGLTNIKFWSVTKKRVYLDHATEAGASLIARARRTAGGLSWPGTDGKIQYGLGHGSAGVGLFLIHLYSATGNAEFKAAAIGALDFDLAASVELDGGGITFPKDDDESRVLLPYLEHGSAGIGVACLRFFKVLEDRRYLDLADRIRVDCARKYTIFPGREGGLAGLGEFLLDGYALTKDERYLDGAYRAAAGLRLFAIEDQDGVAFPGSGLARISCDFATGTSGILHFLARLLNGTPGAWEISA